MIKRKSFARALGAFLAMLVLFLGCSGNQDIPPRTYSISGNVYENFFDLPDVEMILSGAASRTTKTDKDGGYSFTGLPNGNYKVTPKLEGYFFDPVSKNITIDGADVDEVDFYGEQLEGNYSISGTVVSSGGSIGLNGVTIALSGEANRTTTTDGNGEYEFTGRADGNYTVTPSLKNHAFTPINRDVVVSGENEVVGDFTATLISTSTYTQSDLTGTWRTFLINPEQWQRFVLSVENDGDAVFEDYEDSQGGANPDPGDLILTMDDDGAVTVVNIGRLTMASNKQLMAGNLGGLIMALKSGGTYEDSDLYDTAFVYHLLKIGAINEWRHGTGTIDADGTMNIASETTSGAAPFNGDLGQVVVSFDGVVSLDTKDTFKGFLSGDKKTVVATETVGGSYVLWVIQITGKTYTSGALPDSVANVHMLAGGTVPAPLSADWTATTFNGTMVASNWNASSFSAPGSCTPSVDASGVVTIPGDANHGATHGQLSDDEKFIVGTKTLYKDGSPFGYALVIYTIK
jgi:hypothetical protein